MSTYGNDFDNDPYSLRAQSFQKQVAERNAGAVYRNTLIDYNKLNVPVWNPKNGQHAIDIIPFPAGPDMPIDPTTGTVATMEGYFDYLVDFEVHARIGENNFTFVCPNKNYGKFCPVCAYISNNVLEKDDWMKVRTIRRTAYLVWVHDSPEEENKGVQLWIVPAAFMEKPLRELSALRPGGGVRPFWHPEKGYTVAFSMTKKGKFYEYTGHSLFERERPIPKKILEQAFPVDTVLNMHVSRQEIEEAFNGTPASDHSTMPSHTDTGDDAPLGSNTGIDWYTDDSEDSTAFHEATVQEATSNSQQRRPVNKKFIKRS